MKETLIKIGLFLLVAFIFAGLINAIRIDENNWREFSAKNNCKVVGKMAGSVVPVTGFDAKGNAVFSVATTPTKTAWKCDDGITYWR